MLRSFVLAAALLVVGCVPQPTALAPRPKPAPTAPQTLTIAETVSDSGHYRVTFPTVCDAEGCANQYTLRVTRGTQVVTNLTANQGLFNVAVARPGAGDSVLVTFQVWSVRRGVQSTAPVTAQRVLRGPPISVPTPVAPKPPTVNLSVPTLSGDTVRVTAQWSVADTGLITFSGLTTRGTIQPAETQHLLSRAVAYGDSVSFSACVRSVRAGLSSAEVCRTTGFRRPADVPPPPPDTLIVDTLVSVPPAGIDSVTFGAAELPRVYVDTDAMPVMTGRTINVPAGGNLQVVLDTAQRGDIIQLAEGATYTGNFKLKPKIGTGWIIIRTNTTAIPPQGTRVRPTLVAGKYASIVTPNVTEALTTFSHPDASHYRIIGVRFASADSVKMTYGITTFGNLGATTVEQIPTHIFLDRIWVQGHDSLDTQRCVALNTRYSAVIDSWLEGCHHSGADAQAVIGWTGPGPFKINNNFLEGSGENVMFGGADPRIVGLVPSDIEMRFNHIYKPLSWMGLLRKWVIKNSVETKNVSRWLIEANVIENNWAHGQTGFIVVFKSSNQSGSCYWCVAEDVNFRWNRVMNSPSGFNFKSLDEYNGGGGIHMRRVTVFQIDAIRVGFTGPTTTTGADRRLFQFLGPLTSMHVGNITVLDSANQIIMWDGLPGSDLRFTNNLIGKTTYGMFGSGKGEGNNAINFYAPGAIITGNALIRANPAIYPTGNTFPATAPSVPGVNRAELDRRLQGVVVPR